jgi:hypothetical protein
MSQLHTRFGAVAMSPGFFFEASFVRANSASSRSLRRRSFSTSTCPGERLALGAK